MKFTLATLLVLIANSVSADEMNYEYPYPSTSSGHFNETDNNSEGDHYRWKQNKRCGLFSIDGRFKETVDDSFCGKDFYRWKQDKYCGLFAESGRFKEVVADGHCGEDYYKWGKNRTCSLYAANGRFKRIVDESDCSHLSAVEPVIYVDETYDVYINTF